MNSISKFLLLLILEKVVKVHAVLVGNVDPSGRFDVVDPKDTT